MTKVLAHLILARARAKVSPAQGMSRVPWWQSNVSAVLHGTWEQCICCIAWCVGVMYLLYCMVCGSNVSAVLHGVWE